MQNDSRPLAVGCGTCSALSWALLRPTWNWWKAPASPGWRESPDRCFNVSHAGELALIAVAGHEVGVDVEHVASGWRALEAAGLACTPEEADALRKLPAVQRAETFVRWWTAKEAYLKATGQGFSIPPDRVEVAALSAGAAAPVRVVDDGPSRWWVRRLRPAPGYVGAVAAEGPDWQLRLRQSDPEALAERHA